LVPFVKKNQKTLTEGTSGNLGMIGQVSEETNSLKPLFSQFPERNSIGDEEKKKRRRRIALVRREGKGNCTTH